MTATLASPRALDDDAFLRAFESLELPPSEFHHAEHLRAAWCCFREEQDFAVGSARFVSYFRSYVARIGAEAKYHETITWFFLTLVHERLAQTPEAGWEEFQNRHADLFANGHSLLKARYRPETLQNPLARRTFLLPDLPAVGA